MNHFLALRPDGATRDRLAALADRLRAWDLPAAWSEPEDYHLTLCFLGELDQFEADLVPTLVADVAGSVRRPSLSFTGLGASGTRGNGVQAVPRAVFVALTDAEHACAGLHRDLGACLDQPAERSFLPHVTLCRPQPAVPAGRLFHDWPHLLEAHGLADWGPCVMESLGFYRSTDRRVRYEALATWPLH